MTPNISSNVQEEIVALPQSAELNSDGGIQIEPEPKLSAISSHTGNIPIIYEATETSPPSIASKRPLLYSLQKKYRGELSILEKYRYDLSRAQLKASSRTSALLAGFAMVALVELQYERTTPPFLLITLGVVTTLLVSVHLLALMMSTCILPYIEANGCTQDSPHIRLKFYIDLSWLFSTCIGLVLFLIEIGIIFFVKFYAVNYITAAYITTAMLIPVVVIFTIFSCLIHKNRFIHSINRVGSKAFDLQKFLIENPTTANIPNATSIGQHL
ncbi:Protein orai [Dirofilaria immitis]